MKKKKTLLYLLAFILIFICSISDVNAIDNKTYTCSYKGTRTNDNLTMTYLQNDQYINGKWDISYPDGSTQTLVGTEVNGNFMPGSDCEDVYYIAKENRIRVAIGYNEDVTSNVTFGSLCESYSNSEIEHFCSGLCTYGEMSCPISTTQSSSSGGCPKYLLPIIQFIKRGIFPIIQIAIPIILIIMGSLDLGKAVLSNDDKGISQAVSTFIKRVIAAVALFFVTTIVSLIMGIFTRSGAEVEGDTTSWRDCWDEA